MPMAGARRRSGAEEGELIVAPAGCARLAPNFKGIPAGASLPAQTTPASAKDRCHPHAGSESTGSPWQAPGAHQAPRRGRPRCVAADVGEVFLPHQ